MPVSASALASESRSLSVVNHISTASKPAAAAARTRSPASGPASVKSSSMFAESWDTSGVLVGEGGRGRPAGEGAQLALQEVAAQQAARGGVRALVALEDDPAVVTRVEERPGD